MISAKNIFRLNLVKKQKNVFIFTRNKKALTKLSEYHEKTLRCNFTPKRYLKICKPITIEVSKRFYPGKDKGPEIIKKAFDAATKQNPPCKGITCGVQQGLAKKTNVPSSSMSTPQAAPATPLPKPISYKPKPPLIEPEQPLRDKLPVNSSTSKLPYRNAIIEKAASENTKKTQHNALSEKLAQPIGEAKAIPTQLSNVNHELAQKDLVGLPAVPPNVVPDLVNTTIPEPKFELQTNVDGNMFLIPITQLPPQQKGSLPSVQATDATKTVTKELTETLGLIDQRLNSNNPVDYLLQKKIDALNKKIEDQSFTNYTNCLAQMKEEIKKYEKIINKETSEEKHLVLKTIKNLMEEYKTFTKYIPEHISRDLEEYKKIEYLLQNTTYKWKDYIMKHLEQETITVPRTKEQYEQVKKYCEVALDLLQENKYIDLPDFLFQELLRRAGVIINNDVRFNGDELYGKQFVLEGEGPSLHNKTYKIMSSNPEKYFVRDSLQLTKEQLDDIFNNVYKNIFFIGIIENNDCTKFIESGDEIHMNIITEIKDIHGESLYISLGHLTSTKDSTTVKLTNKQHINNPRQDVKKAQYFRPYKQFIAFDKNAIKFDKEGTLYIQNTDLENINIPKVIAKTVETFREYSEKNPIRKPLVVDKDMLRKIAIELYKQNLDDRVKDIEEFDKNMNGKTPDECIREANKALAQYNNCVKEIKDAFILRAAPPEYQDAAKIIKDSEKEIKNEKAKKKEIEKNIKIQKYKK